MEAAFIKVSAENNKSEIKTFLNLITTERYEIRYDKVFSKIQLIYFKLPLFTYGQLNYYTVNLICIVQNAVGQIYSKNLSFQ